MKRIWQRATAEVARVFEYLLRSLPPETLIGLLALGGRAVFVFGARRRQIALENLRVVFGDRYDETERRGIARASFESFGRAMAEALLSDRLFASPSAIEARIRPTGAGWEQLRGEIEHGGMFVTAHLGSWEVAVPYLRHLGMRFHPVVRTLSNPYLDEWITKTRAGPDGVIRKGGAVRRILSVIKKGGWVGYVGDQNAGRHGLFVPFFGIDASTFPTPGMVVHRFSRPAYIGVCVRRPGIRFEIRLERVPEPPEGLEPEAGVRWVLEHVNRQLERWIEHDPDQYTWLHRRWKTRPKDEGLNPELPNYPHKRPKPGRPLATPIAENP